VNIALTTAYACAPVSGVLSEAVFVVVVVIVIVLILDYDNDYEHDNECCRFQLIGFSVPCYPLKTRKHLLQGEGSEKEESSREGKYVAGQRPGAFWHIIRSRIDRQAVFFDDRSFFINLNFFNSFKT